MNTDHQHFQRMIDESLAGAIAPEREQSLREHLDTCPRCLEYLSAGSRVIASLGGFSFEVDSSLNAGVIASLRLPAEQLQAAHSGPRRRVQRWLAIGLAAVVLTLGGSLLDLRFGDLVASVFDLQRIPVHHGLIALWILPSLSVFLLFPLLPLLSNAVTRRHERSL
jgi:anti-sigma factor RsiW